MADTTMDTPPIQQPEIQPVAQPTPIRYVVPAEPAGADQSLQNLARSLSTVDSGLGAWLEAKDKQNSDADAIKAKADFYKNNSEGYAQAVQEGKIPASSSPTYIQAYKESQGAVAGADLQRKFDAAYDGWGGKSSLDPNAYHNFVTGFLSQNIATDDPDVLRGLMPFVTQMAQQGQARYISDVHTATVNGSVTAHVAQMDDAFSQQRDAALANGQPLNLDAAWGAVTGIRSKYLASGGTADQIDKQIVDLITSQSLQARGQGGPEILSLLDRPVPGTNYTYAKTPYGAEKKVQTLNTLETLGRRAIEDESKALAAANKAELGAVTTQTLNFMVANPGKPIPDQLLAEGSKAGLDPQFRVNAAKWQDTLLKNAGTSDPQDMLHLSWGIMNGGGIDAVREAMDNGQIRNRSDLENAVKLVQETNKAQDMVSPMMKSEQAKEIMSAINFRTQAKNDLSQPFAPQGISDAGLGVQYSFQRQVQDWALAHPGASLADQQEAVAKIGKAVLDTIQPSDGGKVTVTPQPGAPPNPYQPAQPGAPAPTPQPQQQQQQQQPAPPLDPNIHAWFQGLRPEEQASISGYAAKNGGDLNGAITRAYQWQQRQGGGAAQPQGPLAQAAGTVAPPLDSGAMTKQFQDALHGWRETDPNSPLIMHQAASAFMAALHNNGNYVGGYTVAAIKDNPKAAHILDFISGPESRGNYNAYFGHSDSQNDLSKMTLNQVMEWQQERVKAGSPSSATGRYQFMHATLAELKSDPSLHLTGNEKFTPELQDKLAIELLKKRGYDAWVAGKMGDAQFANNLAEEWASLPNVHTGRSVYDGDGLNKSLVTPGQVLTNLGAAKALPGDAADNDSGEE